MSENREQNETEIMKFRNCYSTELGFSLDYPWEWLIYPYNLIDGFYRNPLVSLGTMTIAMSGDPELGPDESCPRILLIVERRVVEDVSEFYSEVTSKQFEKTKVLYPHPSKLASGENSFEWSYEFTREAQEFKAVATLVVKGVLVFNLIGSCLKPQFENMERTLLRVVRSLSLSEPSLSWLTEEYFK